MKHTNILDITSHPEFTHVCDICNEFSTETRWAYININKPFMYANHKSWVYAITIDNIIAKIGESGNMLGFRSSDKHNHPQYDTKGRFSRYIAGSDTDAYIRKAIQPYLLKNSTVSFWAQKCNVRVINKIILGERTSLQYTYHKSLEKICLDKIKSATGTYPILNKARA